MDCCGWVREKIKRVPDNVSKCINFKKRHNNYNRIFKMINFCLIRVICSIRVEYLP